MARLSFWIRWSWRDLRERWLVVGAIALTIALGTGAYAGLVSTSNWRQAANDASYAALRMYDLRVRLAEGAFVPAGALAASATELPGAPISAAQERLVVPTQVDASTASQTILVPGELIGIDVTSAEPRLNDVAIRGGRGLVAADANAEVAILEYHFANHYALPPTGRVGLSGGTSLDYVGRGLTPEYFLVTTARGGLLAEANFAALIVPLATAARVAGHPAQVNDLLVRLRPGADVVQVQADLRSRLARAMPGVPATVMTADDDQAHRILKRDIDSDNQFYSIFALLMLVGAALAAFNLTTRIVESQRRQIGIAMAIGVPRRAIAIRPLLVGAQIAVLGIVLGVAVGLLVDRAMDDLLQRYLAMPVWGAPFEVGIFARAAALGFVLPVAATVYPVWRAVRVRPIVAIRTGSTAAQGSGLAGLVRPLHLPGGSFSRMPLRNVLRTPRRTALTAIGIGAAIAVLVGTAGLVDTFLATIDLGEREVIQGDRNRVDIGLARVEPTDSTVARLRALGVVDALEPELEIPATAVVSGRELDLNIAVIDLVTGRWRPTIVAGTLPNVSDNGPPGVLLTQAAAGQLGLGVGDAFTLRHLRLSSSGRQETVEDQVILAGLQPLPLRDAAYMDASAARLFGLAGMTNRLIAEPAAGQTIETVQRALFGEPDVVSAQPVGVLASVFRNLVDQYLGLLAIVQATALILALLIALNSATIAMDERAREHATMVAFGTRLRTVLAIAVAENALIGLAGAVLGIAAGRLVLEYLVRSVLPNVVPDVGFTVTISPTTLGEAILLGILAVALARSQASAAFAGWTSPPHCASSNRPRAANDPGIPMRIPAGPIAGNPSIGTALAAPIGTVAGVAEAGPLPGKTEGGAGPVVERSHTLLPHTADTGVAVVAPTLAALLEEAAEALAELTADVAPQPPPSTLIIETISLEARDVESLVVAWLNELIGLGEVHRAALVGAAVSVAASHPVARLRAVARFHPYADGQARPRICVKSATYHGLAVGRSGGVWRLTVYLDV